MNNSIRETPDTMKISTVISEDEHGVSAQLTAPTSLNYDVYYAVFGGSRNEVLHKLVDKVFPIHDEAKKRIIE